MNYNDDLAVEIDPVVNPASGLPMIAGGVIDVDGNVYGFSNVLGEWFEGYDLVASDFLGDL